MLLLQIWDFNLGRSRDQNEPDRFGYSKNEEGFAIMSYGELMREISSTKDLGDVYQLTSCMSPEDIALFNVSKKFS